MSAKNDDPALTTLWLPFNEGHLQWPNESTLFLNARTPAPAFAKHLKCVQHFKPEADALVRNGLSCIGEDQLDSAQPFAMTLLLPPRQREHARAQLALAVTMTIAGGAVVLSAANNEGARSFEQDLEQLTGHVTTLSKHKCRVCWARIEPASVNHHLLKEWLALDDIRAINDQFVSRPGVFAWDHFDIASQLLARHLPANVHGKAADLGAGFGYLSVELLKRNSAISQLDAYEADARALSLAERNLQPYAERVDVRGFWHDVTQGLKDRYQLIVSNPPFHGQGRADRPDIGRQFIAAAASSLYPDGELWLVANRHLPYEEVLQQHFSQVQVVTDQKGFKVIRAIKSAPPAKSKPKRSSR